MKELKELKGIVKGNVLTFDINLEPNEIIQSMFICDESQPFLHFSIFSLYDVISECLELYSENKSMMNIKNEYNYRIDNEYNRTSTIIGRKIYPISIISTLPNYEESTLSKTFNLFELFSTHCKQLQAIFTFDINIDNKYKLWVDISTQKK